MTKSSTEFWVLVSLIKCLKSILLQIAFLNDPPLQQKSLDLSHTLDTTPALNSFPLIGQFCQVAHHRYIAGQSITHAGISDLLINGIQCY